MAKDPVCGMEVEEQKAAGTSQLVGDTTGLMMIRNRIQSGTRNPEQ